MKSPHDLDKELDHLEIELQTEVALYGGDTLEAYRLKKQIYLVKQELKQLERGNQ